MKGDMVIKKQFKSDGEEVQTLVSMDEYTVEDEVVDVPGTDKTIPVRNGVRKIPAIGAIFKYKRDSGTKKYLQDWYNKHEYHNVTIIETDGGGKEIGRELWPNTELAKIGRPAYDAASPVFAQIPVNLLPEDIIELKGEG